MNMDRNQSQGEQSGLRGDGMRNFLEGALRGGAAALRGYMEAKVLVAQATNDAELQRARSIEAEARNRLLRLKQQQDYEIGKSQIESNERIAQAQVDAQKFQVVTTTDGQKYIVDAQGNTATQVAQTQADATVQAAEAGAQGQANVATIGAQSDEKVAQIGAEADKAVAQTQAQGQVDAAKVGAEGDQAVAQTQAQSAENVAQIEAQTAQQVAEIENKLVTPGASGGGKPTVSPEAAKAFSSAMSGILRSDPYVILSSSQQVVPRMLALYADGTADAADDLALVNMFQRMIDPGVSVREGDVQLQQSTQSAWGRFALAIQRVTEGALLTPELRQSMVQTAIDLANEDYDVLLPRLKAAGDVQVNMNQELRQAGYSVEDAFPQPLQRFEGTVSMLPSGAVQLTAGGSLGDDGKMTQSGSGGEQGGDMTEQFVSRARQYAQQGKTPAAIRAGMVSALGKSQLTPEQQAEVLRAVATAMGWSPQDFVAGAGEYGGQ